MRARSVSWVGGILLLIVVMGASLTFGSRSLSPAEVWGVLTHSTGLFVDPRFPEPSPMRRSIFVDLRLPRVLLAAIIGAVLAVCGSAMQAITHNELADPYLLGVSAGASTGAVCAIVFSSWVWGVTAGAIVGAVMAFLLLMALLGRSSPAPSRVVLTGVLVGFFFQALTSLVITASGDEDSARGVMFWMLGVLSAARWESVWTAALVGAVGCTLLWSLSRYLDALTLGDDTAATMGVPVTVTRYTVLICVSCLTAVTVAAAGAIGFVGLVVPHAARVLVGPAHRKLIPSAALVGAIFLVIADALGHEVFAPQELPVGVMTALIGVPAFFLIARGRL